MKSEAELLESARQFSFGGRMDKSGSGPIFVRGSGSAVEDIKGKTYLDFNSGQMCAWLGHNHPAIVDAVADACDRLIHAHSSYYNDKEIELAERLGNLLPDPLQKSMFLQSGADANEAAINIARKYTGGFEIISPHTSFHGMSDTTRSLTFAGWHRGYGPPQPGMMAMLAPYCYRCPIGLEPENCELACLDASFELIDAQTTSRPAAVLTEPIFSAGGVIEPPLGWLPELKRRCEERGMLLILDEEQTGLGKTGDTFAFEQEQVIPDIITLAKHFGGGICISSVTTSTEIEEQVVADEFIVTHSHSNDPLACAAGTATLDVLEEQDLAAHARYLGGYLKSKLHELAERFEIIGDIRGRGLLQGIELVRDRQTREPATTEGKAITERCLQDGLIFSVRRDGSVLRFVPPASTTEDQIDRALDILSNALEEASC
ncbi:MAG: aspartate aminotransferase family protein [Chloroflexota bacterium]|nr:aspartate aminotransferase family protein [Chloroflexota bacterium]MDE2894355.1 aspartate aminotransferase family protein [Chloroflexota bacterium]